jgi:RimJ/RimL family protein N-acetyltransferase
VPVALRDGGTVRIRRLQAGDRAAMEALFHRLGPESRRRRFLTPKLELSERELTFLSDIDHIRHVALAAIDPRDGSLVGTARYVRHHDQPVAADIAVEVADDMQRRGIGTALARRLIGAARINGLHRLTATTLWENLPARLLLRGLGFQAVASAGTEIELELDLGTAPRPAVIGGSPAA